MLLPPGGGGPPGGVHPRLLSPCWQRGPPLSHLALALVAPATPLDPAVLPSVTPALSPRWLAPSLAEGSACGRLAPGALPSRRLVLTRSPACSRWLWCLAAPLPVAVLSGALSLCGQAGGTAAGGAGQGGRSWCQTWCRVSSLCRRATRAALFSSVTLHSSNAHWFRSAACPAAQVAATLPSSGVGAGQLPHPCGTGPVSLSPGGTRSWGGRLCSRAVLRLHSSLGPASQ